MPVEHELEACRLLLEGNHYWRFAAGLGTLALAPRENDRDPFTAMLFHQTPLQCLDFGTFQNRLHDFVDTAET